jgi:hypothetical protein
VWDRKAMAVTVIEVQIDSPRFLSSLFSREWTDVACLRPGELPRRRTYRIAGRSRDQCSARPAWCLGLGRRDRPSTLRLGAALPLLRRHRYGW